MFALFKLNHLWDNKINYTKSEVGYSDINTYLSCNTNLKQIRVNISFTLPIKTQKLHRPLLILTEKVQSLSKNWLKDVIDSDSSRKLLWCHYFDDKFLIVYTFWILLDTLYRSGEGGRGMGGGEGGLDRYIHRTHEDATMVGADQPEKFS